MKSPKTKANARKRTPAPIKTTFLELLQALNGLTKDDALVIAALKNIFATYRVRFGRKLAPVRLVAGKASLASLRRVNLNKRSSVWA